MAIKTKGVSVDGKIEKTLSPGNQILKITRLSINEKPASWEGEPYDIIVECEGPEIKDFEGFFLDKDAPEKGRHLGQVGKIRATPYPFRNGEHEGKVFDRETDAGNWLTGFCALIGLSDWADAQDGKFETGVQLVEQFNADKPYEGIWFEACVGGRQYMQDGYLRYDLYFPYAKNRKFAYQVKGTTPSKLMKFDEAAHIGRLKEKKTEEVNGFGPSKASFDM